MSKGTDNIQHSWPNKLSNGSSRQSKAILKKNQILPSSQMHQKKNKIKARTIIA